MKARALILIFLFLISLQTVSADVNGTFGGYVSSSRDLTQSYGSINEWTGDYQLELNHDSGGIPDSYKISDIQASNKTNWSATATNAGDPFYIYYSADGTTKTELVGYGSISVHKNSDAGGGVFNVDVTFWFDNITIDSELSGRQYYILDGAWITVLSYYNNMYRESVGVVYDNYYNANYAHVGPASGPDCHQVSSRKTPGNTNHEYSSIGYFRNDYNIENQGSGFDIDITRTGFETAPELTSSRVRMTYTDTGETYYESSFSAVNTSHYLLNGSFNYYIIRQVDSAQYLMYTSEAGDSGEDHTATIIFNESYYVKPDRVNVSWSGSDFNFTYNEYWITVMGSQDGVSNWQYIDYDYEPEISSDEEDGNRSVALYYNSFNLPFYIKAMIYSYNYQTGDTTVLDISDIILYSDTGSQRGSIWTEKSTYNISEIFYIEFETEYPTVEIELISDTYHDIRTMEGNGHGHLGYAFRTPHNFTAYLYEEGIKTNQTSFSVAATSPMLNIFLESVALKTQFALEYYTDNSSDIITGYRPDGSTFYGSVTDLETNKRKIITGISSSSPPGIYTISLFHDGTTYYNDTIELYSTSEWVYFEASKYETGDRIKIYSYVTDSRQQIRLTDSIGTAVITWTDSAGYIVPNSQTILYFSLTDNNEYGMNINSSIDAGTFRTGNWKVEIIDIDGKPLTNESTYDYTTVSKRIDSPADSSNEMISIFFSPEGAFLLFTVALTMMGLVASKHPAGGGAGAVVGVGFGVYFNVLPVWMLMLMVIALVVLAGVSIAVHFKGK